MLSSYKNSLENISRVWKCSGKVVEFRASNIVGTLIITDFSASTNVTTTTTTNTTNATTYTTTTTIMDGVVVEYIADSVLVNLGIRSSCAIGNNGLVVTRN